MSLAVLAPSTQGLKSLRFDNSFVRELPADGGTGPERRQISEALYARIEPTPSASPSLVAHSAEVAQMLGLTDEDLQSPEFVAVMSGNGLLEGMAPFAGCYGGHQFGNWAGQLGDGRAINLGEVVSEGGSRLTLQLKGAGETPFSRTADGLAVLRSSVREFLCSEAMHHLNVPTTRALSLCLTGDEVMRDMLYDGNAALEPGAVVCRVAQSFTRFGHFQMLAARGERDLLEQFFNYVVEVDFPHLKAHAAGSERVLAWFAEVAERSALMVAHWSRVGFVHGVMNTDNMSVLGDTIDYGPYGWLEGFDPNWTPNTTDAQGKRYRFGHQPAVVQWNLLQLANAIFPLVETAEPLEAILSNFERQYVSLWQTMHGQKLGLAQFQPEDADLADALETVLQVAEVDMTLFYRELATLDISAAAPDTEVRRILGAAFYTPEALEGDVLAAWSGWFASYQARLRRDNEPMTVRSERMNAVNPRFVLRNYLAQLAIDAAEQGDFSRIAEQLDVLRSPYTEQPDRTDYAQKRPEWARSRVGCSMLSCSS